MLRLLTTPEVIEQFGDPARYLQEDGSVSAAWPAAILDSFTLPAPLPLSWGGQATRISCHQQVMPELKRAFDTIAKYPEAWKSINDFGGCYNWRRNRNLASALSRHSWGIAVDLDVKDNPNGSRGQMHPIIIQAFYDIGWKWGGWFSSTPDPMHFEKGVEI